MSVHTIINGAGRKTYKVRWREGGRNHAKHFDRKGDADVFDGEVKRRRQVGELGLLTGGRVLLRDYAVEWWDAYAQPSLTRRTLDVYSVALDLRIVPLLGGYKLQEITPSRVQGWMAQLAAGGSGDPSIVKAATVLQSIMARATLDGLIARNPVSVVRKPSQRRTRNPDMIPPRVVEAIRAQLEPRDAAIVSVLAYAGLRPESEAIILTWPQVDKRTMHVFASKTGRERHIRLLAPLAADLAEWASVGKRTGPVFGEWGRYDWRNWVRRVWRPAAIKAGLTKDTRPRDLRGSFASLLIWEGQTVVEVAGQLGHSPAQCLSLYAGVFAEFSIDERTSAEAAITAAREPTVPR